MRSMGRQGHGARLRQWYRPEAPAEPAAGEEHRGARGVLGGSRIEGSEIYERVARGRAGHARGWAMRGEGERHVRDGRCVRGVQDLGGAQGGGEGGGGAGARGKVETVAMLFWLAARIRTENICEKIQIVILKAS